MWSAIGRCFAHVSLMNKRERLQRWHRIVWQCSNKTVLIWVIKHHVQTWVYNVRRWTAWAKWSILSVGPWRDTDCDYEKRFFLSSSDSVVGKLSPHCNYLINCIQIVAIKTSVSWSGSPSWRASKLLINENVNLLTEWNICWFHQLPSISL